MNIMKSKSFLVVMILLTLPLMALFAQPVAALPTDVGATCIGNGSLTFSISSVRCINAVCSDIQRNATVFCQYGCNEKTVPNECNPAPFQANLLLYFVLIVAVIGIFGVWRYFKSR